MLFFMQALNMIGYLRKSFNNILREADWMDEPTRIKALRKVTPDIN